MAELEMAAVVYGLTNAGHFTYGAQNIQVYSDHSPLVGLSRKALDDIDNPRLMSLFEKISHYSFQIHHIPGKVNRPADVLSRLGHETCEFPEVPSHIPVRTIAAVQTRSGIKIAKDLVDMSVRALGDREYVELMEHIKTGTDLSMLP